MLMLAAALATSFSAAAEWIYDKDVDLMTDRDTSVVIALGEPRGAVVVRCDGKDGYDVYFNFDDYLGNKSNNIALRFDQGEVKVLQAESGTGGDSRFLRNEDSAVVIKQIKDSKRLVVRGTDYKNVPNTFVVNLSGFSEQASKLGCLNGIL